MGKITGFMEFDRQDRSYRPVDERLTHYKEFVIPLPEKDTKVQAARAAWTVAFPTVTTAVR